MTKPNKGKDKTRMYNISRKMAPFQHYQLYVITRFPDNPVTGRRGGHVDIMDMICELAQVAYIIITAVILAKDMTMAKLKVSQRSS